MRQYAGVRPHSFRVSSSCGRVVMSRWLTLTFLLPASIYALRAHRYECGEHGRFEYCTDRVPSCLVGCNCHPGYYFDTETKICEPNAKREPTRLQIIMAPLDFSETMPTSTTTNLLVDNQVEAIAKDADDLGWDNSLYSQSSKIIKNMETEVTKTSQSKLLNRRSGRNFGRKHFRKSKKPKGPNRINIKKKSLRKKLLRITEDDSLFNSKSEDDSSKSKSGSDSGCSSISDTSSSDVKKDSGSDHHNGKPDASVGEGKFVLKKMKASILFLPNLETPFFPPIALPPPPPVPIYPMVAIPPMPMPGAIPGFPPLVL